MSHRRKRQDAGGALVLLAIAAVVVLTVVFFVLAPAAVLVWWLATELLCTTIRHQRTYADVAATPLEQAEIARRDQDVAALAATCDGFQQDGDRRGLRRRGDGMFDERSSVGRDLNGKVRAYGERHAAAQDALDRSTALVQGRIDTWVGRRSRRSGARAGLLCFLLVVGVLYAMRPDIAVQVAGLSPMTADALPDTKVLLGCIAMAALCAWVVNLVAYSLKRNSLVR